MHIAVDIFWGKNRSGDEGMLNPSRRIAVVQMYKYSHIITRVKLSTDFPYGVRHTFTGPFPDLGSIHEPENFKPSWTFDGRHSLGRRMAVNLSSVILHAPPDR